MATGSLALAFASFVHSKRREQMSDERSVLERVVQLETKVDLMFRDISFAASFAAAQTLHRHDDQHQMDELIDKFTSHRLALDEVPVFIDRLERVVAPDSPANDTERYAADVLLRVLRQRYE